MKFSTILTTLALSYLATPAIAFSSEEICRDHRPKVYEAIQRLCGATDIRVFSQYASAGKTDQTGKAEVKIGGVCFPAQWVPLKFCKIQFYNMCARKGRGKWYGRNACQYWSIKYDGDEVFKVWNWKRDALNSGKVEVVDGEEFETMDEYSPGEEVQEVQGPVQAT